jgi:hypothetical protein
VILEQYDEPILESDSFFALYSVPCVPPYCLVGASRVHGSNAAAASLLNFGTVRDSSQVV